MLAMQNLELDNKDTSYEMYVVLLSACPFPWTLLETCLYIFLQHWLPKPIYI